MIGSAPRPRLVVAVIALAVPVTSACRGDTRPMEVPDAADTVYVAFETEQDIAEFFEEVNYSPEAWAEGVREIPRMYITEVAARWRERADVDLAVQTKKRIFFRTMAPLALRSNELIRAEREWLLDLPPSDALDEEERRWLAELASDYGVEVPDIEPNGSVDAGSADDGPTDDGAADNGSTDDGVADEGSTDDGALAVGALDAVPAEAWDAVREELEVRVDEVPPSLVLAQAANESGWGTSRFAHEGNALFGQWSFGGSGMLPAEQRASLGDYRVAAFESPLLSVVAYMRNLNTHRAYADLRALRAEARAAGRRPRGYRLAGGLVNYSERGRAYVEEIRSIIDSNHLREVDETHLAPGPVYLVVPADEMP